MIPDEKMKEIINKLEELGQKYRQEGLIENNLFSKGFAAGVFESIKTINNIMEKKEVEIEKWVCPGCGGNNIRKTGECKGNYYLKCDRCGKNFCVITGKD